MLSKNKDRVVRSHNEEREWLLKLGGGDLVEGVKNLARQLKGPHLADRKRSSLKQR
jgi:hypothetical protein